MTTQPPGGVRYFGPDNHADWCPDEHDGACLDVILAKVDAMADDAPEQELPDPDDPRYRTIVAALRDGIALADATFEGPSRSEQSDDPEVRP